MLKKGDSVCFKVAYYNSEMKVTKETDEILEGVIKNVGDTGLIITVADKDSKPYFVTYDRVMDSL